MNEKRFIVETVEITDCCTDDSRIVKVITDKDELYSYNDLYEIKDKLNEQQSTINKQEEEIKKLKKTERSWRKIHCCNKESNNCGIVIEQQAIIEALENEIQRQNNELKNTRKEFIKKTDELKWLKSEDYLKKIY